MKTVILFGSPHKDGNTRMLTDAFADVVRQKHGELRIFYLNDLNIRPCQGCLACLAEGACRINDDMKDIRRYVGESDLIVYATPIYWFGPSGQIKLVMDRCIAFLDAKYNSRIKGKRAVTLLSCGDSSSDTCRPSQQMFEKTFSLLGIDYVGNIEATGCTEKGSVPSETLEAVKALARSLL